MAAIPVAPARTVLLGWLTAAWCDPSISHPIFINPEQVHAHARALNPAPTLGQAAHRLAASLAGQGQTQAALDVIGPFFCVTRRRLPRFDILAELLEDSSQEKVQPGTIRLSCVCSCTMCMRIAGRFSRASEQQTATA